MLAGVGSEGGTELLPGFVISFPGSVTITGLMGSGGLIGGFGLTGSGGLGVTGTGSNARF